MYLKYLWSYIEVVRIFWAGLKYKSKVIASFAEPAYSSDEENCQWKLCGFEPEKQNISVGSSSNGSLSSYMSSWNYSWMARGVGLWDGEAGRKCKEREEDNCFTRWRLQIIPNNSVPVVFTVASWRTQQQQQCSVSYWAAISVQQQHSQQWHAVSGSRAETLRCPALLLASYLNWTASITQLLNTNTVTRREKSWRDTTLTALLLFNWTLLCWSNWKCEC